jgi:hypothetical protein
MNTVRRFGLAVVGAILFVTLITTAWADVAARTIGRRDTVKAWLDESGFYDNVTKAALEGLRSVEGEETGTVPVDDPNLQTQIRSIFTPEFLKENIENLLDGTYNWLDGKVDKPDFAIDLRDVKVRLASSLGQYAAERAATLPPCTVPQPEFDAFNANCLPSNVSVSDVANTVETEFLNNPEFLKDEVLTADSFHKPGEGQTVTFFATPNADHIRSAYKLGSWAAPILAFLALLSLGVIILLSSTRRAGLIRAGFLTIGAGVVLGLTYIGMSQLPNALNDLSRNNIDQARPATQELVTDMINVISSDIRNVVLIYTLIYLFLGVALIVISKLIRKDKELVAEESVTSTNPPAIKDSTVNDFETVPVTVKKPTKKPPTKIQL